MMKSIFYILHIEKVRCAYFGFNDIFVICYDLEAQYYFFTYVFILIKITSNLQTA